MAQLIPYAPGPADDVFALGVTAYRLVTGEYPPSTVPTMAEARVWGRKGPGPRAPRTLNSRCCRELSVLILRMLSARPEARGSARALAEALEKAARRAGRAADAPLFINGEPPARVSRPEFLAVPSWLVAAGLAGLAVGAGWMWSALPVHESVRGQAAEGADAGTVGLGDTVRSAPVQFPQSSSALSPIALDMPSKPFPGQTRPDANGRCPHEYQVVINSGCWAKLSVDDKKKCATGAYVYKGDCYLPVFSPPRPTTSSPPEPSDGG